MIGETPVQIIFHIREHSLSWIGTNKLLLLQSIDCLVIVTISPREYYPLSVFILPVITSHQRSSKSAISIHIHMKLLYKWTILEVDNIQDILRLPYMFEE